MSNLSYLLQRSFASACLSILKLKALVPCEVEDKLTSYNGRITEIVFDPIQVEEVNARFQAEGYEVQEGMKVIAVTEGGSILLWGGANSVFHLQRGEHIDGFIDYHHLAFQDVSELFGRFKFKNRKTELDGLIEQLEQKYRRTSN